MLVPTFLDRSLTGRPVLRTHGFTILLVTAVVGALGALHGGLPQEGGWTPEVMGIERVTAAILAVAAVAALTRSHFELRLAVAERARAEAAARAEALTDELTGLYNRRGFRTLAEHQLRVARRTGRDALLLYLDLDGFKPINDGFGHAEGDRALREVADLLRATVRDSDAVARLGGDEFAVLIADADEATEHAVVGRLRQALTFRNLGVARAYPLSVSIGSTRFDADRGMTLDAMVQRADAALYEAKRQRRLQVA